MESFLEPFRNTRSISSINEAQANAPGETYIQFCFVNLLLELLSLTSDMSGLILQLRFWAGFSVGSGRGGLVQPSPEGPSENEGVGRGGSEYEARDQSEDFDSR